MKATRNQVLQTLLFLLIGLFIVYYQINQLSVVERNSALEAIKNANFYWIFLAFSLSILSHVIRAFRWTSLINTANENVKVHNAFYAVMIGYFVNGFLPRVGEFFRCGILARKENVKFEKILGTVVAERMFDLIMLLSVVTLTLFLQFDFLFGLIQEKLILPFIDRFIDSSQSLVQFLLFLLISLVFLFFLLKFIFKKFRLGDFFSKKWEGIKTSFLEGFQTILKLENKWLFVLQSVSMWVIYFFMSFLVFQSLPETKHLGVNAGLSVLTNGSLALLIPTPGGLGTYHEFVSLTLQLYDISEVLGVSLSWLIWSANFAAVLLVGLLSFLLISIKTKK